jgi:hypothetical protein
MLWPAEDSVHPVVDDEPDLEMLILQRFRRQLSDSEFSFTFADNCMVQ